MLVKTTALRQKYTSVAGSSTVGVRPSPALGFLARNFRRAAGSAPRTQRCRFAELALCPGRSPSYMVGTASRIVVLVRIDVLVQLLVLVPMGSNS